MIYQISKQPKKYAPDVLIVMITSLPTISLNQIGKTKEEYDSGGDNYNILIYSQYLLPGGLCAVHGNHNIFIYSQYF